MFELINIMLKWVTELVVIGIQNIYTLLYIAIQTTATVFIMQSFLKFDTRISWLVGALVAVWLTENIIVKKVPWSELLFPSVLVMLFLIVFITGIRGAWRKITAPAGKNRRW